MNFEYGYSYIGKKDGFTITLHRATMFFTLNRGQGNPLWYVEIDAYGVKHYEAYRAQASRIEKIIQKFDLSGDDLVWTKERSEEHERKPWEKTGRPILSRKEVVYFIEAIGSGRIKIGKTNKLNERFSLAKTMCPYPPLVIGYIDGYSTEETEIHKKFQHLNRYGEWFEATDELRAYIEEHAIKPTVRSSKGGDAVPME